ncbi:hypothetical protein BS78_03G253200 [Paspalum vaginatum]|uniref:Late embryogenesis abundant protein LEA-2 subgroup domain-containing protein n=1 Tax=Paspalum vaginatum TaxID=158149 RepID=A0A9W7XAX1_9POAL|nr:hypothetical protein BS78_K302600 [Paspalum vaginatum]KAJ1285073.1 hypothetical protein BS78_03G253200 [Paspalum vaginatum]
MMMNSFHEGHADTKKKLPHIRKRERDTLLVELLSMISFIAFGILLPVYFFLYDMPPEFSIQRLAAIRGFDSDDTPAAPGTGTGSVSISTAFNVTMHASNRRATGRCYRDGGEALVSYDGFTIATARLPGFCVPGKGAREIEFLAAADGVGLPEHVRDRMALEQRVGATLLDVEVKLFRSDDGSDRPMWIWCGLRMSDGTPRPPNVAPCTVLGLQNWFSVDLK